VQCKGGVKTGKSDWFKNAGECLFFKQIKKSPFFNKKHPGGEKGSLNKIVS